MQQKNEVIDSAMVSSSPISIKLFDTPTPIEHRLGRSSPNCFALNLTPTPDSAFRRGTIKSYSPITSLPSTNTVDENGLTFGDAMNTVMGCYYN